MLGLLRLSFQTLPHWSTCTWLVFLHTPLALPTPPMPMLARRFTEGSQRKKAEEQEKIDRPASLCSCRFKARGAEHAISFHGWGLLASSTGLLPDFGAVRLVMDAVSLPLAWASLLIYGGSLSLSSTHEIAYTKLFLQRWPSQRQSTHDFSNFLIPQNQNSFAVTVCLGPWVALQTMRTSHYYWCLHQP